MYVESISDDVKLHKYVYGLDPQLSADVSAQNPSDLFKAIELAERYSRKYRRDASFQHGQQRGASQPLFG